MIAIIAMGDLAAAIAIVLLWPAIGPWAVFAGCATGSAAAVLTGAVLARRCQP